MSNVDSTQLLSMALVLGGGDLAPSKEILYADYIDSAAAVSAFNSLVDLGAEGGLCKNTFELITTNDSLMSKTNSNQFYNGAEAQKQFSNMEQIGFKFEQIAQYVNSSDELSEIENGIKQYNQKLTELKKKCRRKLLQNTAEQFNKEKHEWEGFPKRKTYKYSSDSGSSIIVPPDDPEFNFCVGDNSEEYEWDMVDSSTTREDFKDDTGMIYHTCYHYKNTYEIHKYKFIKYWNFFKGWDTKWFDPDVEEMEQLFAKVGADLPYDKALIIGQDAD